MLTDAVNEDAGQDEVEDVEHGPAPQLDGVGDVDVGLWAARVEDDVALGPERLQLELAVRLVVRRVPRLVDDRQVQLQEKN